MMLAFPKHKRATSDVPEELTDPSWNQDKLYK